MRRPLRLRPAEALRYRGRDVAVVGAANSAGQAALHLAQQARGVTLLVRGSSLEKSMSRYLVDRIGASGNIEVILNARVIRAEGADDLEALNIADSATGTETRLEVDALFVLIGGVPLTAGCRDGSVAIQMGF